MPSPSSSLATLRPDLAASLEEFDLQANRGGFIALQALPVIDVAEAAGVFGRIPIEQLLQCPDTARSPGSGYSRGNWKFETDSYATKEQGHEEPVDDNEARMYANYFDAEQVSAERAREAVLMSQEQRVAAALFNATTFSSQKTTIVNEWDDFDNATPIDDIETGIAAVYSRCGLWCNTLIINRKVFRNLRRCAQILERIASNGAGSAVKARDVTVQMLSEVFDIDKILVAGGSKNTAKEGQAAAVDQVWSSEYAMVCVTEDRQDVRRPCIGRTFHWAEDGSLIGGLIETYRDETIRGDVVRARHQVGEKMMLAEAAQLFDNVTT